MLLLINAGIKVKTILVKAAKGVNDVDGVHVNINWK